VTETEVLSKLTSVRVKVVATRIAQQLCGEELDMVKIRKTILETLENNEDDLRAVISSLHFILKNGAKHAVEAEGFKVELQQLGLPQKTGDAIVKVYIKYQDAIAEEFRKTSFDFPRLDSMDWRVDYVMDTSQSEDVDTPVVQMQLQLTGESNIASAVPVSETKKPKSLTFEMSMDKFRVLYGELKTAARIMNGLDV
jgi:COMM domain containing 4